MLTVLLSVVCDVWPQTTLQGMAALKHANSDQSLYLMPEFQNRLSVLRSLQYIDAEETVLLKVHPPTKHSVTY